jgi:hypothetical protein
MDAKHTALIAAALAIALSGCATVSAEWAHTSHPMAGYPFGPSYEEDTLDTLNVIGRHQIGRTYVEMGVGYKLADGGFYGPELTFTSRIGVEIWSRK